MIEKDSRDQRTIYRLRCAHTMDNDVNNCKGIAIEPSKIQYRVSIGHCIEFVQLIVDTRAERSAGLGILYGFLGRERFMGLSSGCAG